jgi:AraC-like DNA-binding protein
MGARRDDRMTHAADVLNWVDLGQQAQAASRGGHAPMTAPIRTETSHSARILAPHPSLAASVRCYFAAQTHGDVGGHPLLPDGCVDLLFHLTDSPGAPISSVVGVTTSPLRVHPAPGTALFGVTFSPGEALRFLDVPLHSLSDRIVDLTELLGSDALAIASRLRGASTNEARAASIDAFLLDRLARSRRQCPLARPALEVLRAHGGQLSMRALHREVGSSERRLQRAFLQETGVSPKTMARIMRLQTVIARLARHPVPTMTILAYESGFADQAHFNHEFRALTGMSPAAFARAVRAND